MHPSNLGSPAVPLCPCVRTCSGRALQQCALRNFGSQIGELLRRLQELDELHHLHRQQRGTQMSTHKDDITACVSRTSWPAVPALKAWESEQHTSTLASSRPATSAKVTWQIAHHMQPATMSTHKQAQQGPCRALPAASVCLSGAADLALPSLDQLRRRLGE